MAVYDTTRPVSNNGLAHLFANAVAAVKSWNSARVTHKALSNLTDRELEDIGLTRSQINQVARNI